MKNLILFLILLTIFPISESFSQHISKNELDKSILNHIPTNWIIRDTTSGDLNKDGQADLALVIQNDDRQNYRTNNDNFGSDSINSNERLLLIFFKNEDGFKLIKKVDAIIPEHVSPTMDDPYWGMSIKKGVLETGYHFWANAGSWLMFETTYRFRYQNNGFYLIGIEHDSTHRGTMENEKISVNFSTRKALITKIIPQGEEEKTTSQWKNFELEKLYDILEVSPTNIKVLDMYL